MVGRSGRRSRAARVLAAAVGGVLACGPGLARAADQYWDVNGSTAGAGGATPLGTWDAGAANWTSDPAGASATTTWADGNTAIFSAGNDATGAYTVTVSGAVAPNRINFKDGVPTFTGGTINLGAGGVTNYYSNGNVSVINSALNLSAAQSWTTYSALTVGGAVGFNNALTVNNAGPGGPAGGAPTPRASPRSTSTTATAPAPARSPSTPARWRPPPTARPARHRSGPATST